MRRGFEVLRNGPDKWEIGDAQTRVGMLLQSSGLCDVPEKEWLC